MIALAIAFWVSAGIVLYAYAIYPLLLAAIARMRRGRIAPPGPLPSSVSIVIAARNEAANIGRRIDELAGQIGSAGVSGEIIVVSDGSTDATAAAARQHSDCAVRVIELTENVGKAAALSAGCAVARNQILIFADARQRWAPDALHRLIENFEDPTVGAVGGELMLEDSDGLMGGMGLYWRYEKWLRRQESFVGSVVGVSGAIAAVRRELFQPIPEGTILDDVYWPLCVAMQNFKVMWDGRAKAFDRLPPRPADEFRRKVRTLSGNFQLIARLPGAMLPWQNPIWAQFLSHKVARLVVPWALLLMLLASAYLDGTIYRAAFWAQAVTYAIGLAGIVSAGRMRLRLASAAGSFLVLNAAAWVAFWVWLLGRAGRTWRPTLYDTLATSSDSP